MPSLPGSSLRPIAVVAALLVLASPIGLPGCKRSTSRGRGGAVQLTELMAANASFPVTDGRGDLVHQDWVELHNAGASAVQLAGWSLSDNPARPTKFSFPAGTTLPAGGYLVVFCFNAGRCTQDCDLALLECRKSPALADETSTCQELQAACLQQCVPPAGLVAPFGLGSTASTVFLYRENGGQLVDQIGVRNQLPDLSNGKDPISGVYGVMYLPTPGAANFPINLKAAQPGVVSQGPAACDGEVELRLGVQRDVAAPHPVVVTAAWADVTACSDSLEGLPLTPAAVVEDVPAGGNPISVDTSRKDPEGSPVEVEVEEQTFLILLPPAPCGVQRKYRIEVSDGLSASVREGCVIYGETPATMLINEYQAGNTQFPFEYVNKDGDTVPLASPPDWLEVVNYGTEPAEIGHLGLATRGDLKDIAGKAWLFGRDAGITTLAPGQLLWVLADGDGGQFRRTYYRPGDRTQKYFSTHFRLQADRKTPPFDEFSLVDSRTQTVLDRAVLDFSAYGFELARGKSAGRFPDIEGTAPNALVPGTISDCPTPESENLRTCEVPPLFEKAVTIEGASAVHCPGPGEPVTLRAKVNFDKDTPMDRLEVELRISPSMAAEVTVEPDPTQDGAAPASTLYDISVALPGQPAGTHVEFGFTARDLRLLGLGIEATATHDASAERGAETAFEYLVGYLRPEGAPWINEVIPGNQGGDSGGILLPPFVGVPAAERSYPDFVELFNPSGASLDLAGYYLTSTKTPGEPIPLRRRWRFPAAKGSVIPPGGFLGLYFGPPPPSLPQDPPPADQDPPYLEVTGFNLDSCAETIYLIAPDGAEAGANCVVDSLSWSLALAVGCKVNVAYGRLCDGCSTPGCLGELAAPSPVASNAGSGLRPLIFRDSFHQSIIPQGDRNACITATDTVKIDTVFFLDTRLQSLFDSAERFQSVSYLLDRGLGQPEEEVVVRQPPGGFKVCLPGERANCAAPPEGYSNASFTALLSPPYGKTVRYRARLVDVCGAVFETEPWSIGTVAETHPRLLINELDRFSPISPAEATAPRAWIELFNPTTSDVDAGGMYLSDDPSYPRKSRLPDGSTVPAGGVLLVLTDGKPDATHAFTSLLWPSDTGTIYLLDADARGACIVDSLTFSFVGAPVDAAFGRDPDGGSRLGILDEPTPGETRSGSFVRGDADTDERVNVADMVTTLLVLFGGSGASPPCEDALDANDDGKVDAADPAYVGSFLFGRGPLLPPPYPRPGADPTPDNLQPCRR